MSNATVVAGPLEQLPLPLTYCQRWRHRRGRYVPAQSLIDPSRYAVEAVTFSQAREFVRTHHYSGSMPAVRRQYGLFERAAGGAPFNLVGVAAFSVPAQKAVIPKYLGCCPNEGVELGRLVLTDDVGGNGESWFVARAMRLLKQDLPQLHGVVAYCDPVARYDESGELVKPGHIGTVYQALTARFFGRGSPRTLVLGREGRVLSERTLSKARNGERGADYALREVEEQLGVKRAPFEDACAYVRRALLGARRLRHPGNLVFGFALGAPLERKRARARMAESLAYLRNRPDLDSEIHDITAGLGTRVLQQGKSC